jgi:glycerophosphoryl diester phosphodiesterase
VDGATEQRAGGLRRVVLAVLLVIGVVTTGYAFVATRPDASSMTAQDTAPDEVVTAVRPSDNGDGPLRLGRILVAGRHGDPVARPEHTAESYAAAIDAGVDYVEAEVVMSKDGRLVVRGSNQLSRTTDVADHPEFADRQTTKTIDDADVTDWFTEDFTLAELRTLHAVEAKPDQRPDSASHDGDYAVLGFDDLLSQVKKRSKELDRDIGVFVRPQRPTYFRGLGLPLEPAIATSLRRAGLVLDPERVTVESPDLSVLERLEDLVGDNVLSAYVPPAGDPDELSAERLADLPDTIDAVAVAVDTFTGLDAKDVCGIGTRVHDADLAMIVFPVSYENALLAASLRNKDDPSPGAAGDLLRQLRGLRDAGADVVLADSPTEVVDSLAELVSRPDLQASLCDSAR